MFADTDYLPGQDLLEVVVGCRRHVNTAHADVWEYVAAFCGSAASRWVQEPSAGVVHAWSYGGAGTPEVPEGAVAELAGQLGESREAMTRVVAISMNVWHRLPRIRYAVELGDVDWRKAELVAAGTLHVTEAVVAGVRDLLLPEGTDPEVSLLARITCRRLADLIAQVQVVVDCASRTTAPRLIRSWDVRHVTPGSWLWHAPRDRRYLVTAGTTVTL